MVFWRKPVEWADAIAERVRCGHGQWLTQSTGKSPRSTSSERAVTAQTRRCCAGGGDRFPGLDRDAVQRYAWGLLQWHRCAPAEAKPLAHCTPAYASLCVGHVARPIPPSCISPTRTVLTSVVARPELADMDERVLTRALRILEEQGKAVVIDDDEEPGVKFF